MQTKKEKVIEHLQAGETLKALKIAKTFRRDFDKEEQSVVARAFEMSYNPQFYEMLGFDKEEQLEKAEQILTNTYLK